LKQAIALAALFLILHAVSVHAVPAHAMAVSYFFTLAVPLIAVASCFRTGRGAGATEWKWLALCAGLLLWEAALAGAAWQDLMQQDTAMVTAVDGFVYFLFGAPLLLAICASPNDRRLPAVAWIDGIMATAIGVIAYREIFSFLPGLGTPDQMPTVTHIAYIYDAENVSLAALAGTRLLAAECAEEQAFYRALFGYLCAYSIATGFYNHVAVIRWQLNMGSSLDVLIDLPLMILAGFALHASAHVGRWSRYVSRSTMMTIQAGISVSLPLVLLVLGVLAIGHSPFEGMVSIVGSLAGYGLRNVLCQVRLRESEDELLESRRIFERAAMIDPLTGVGNRRAFDQALIREWHRADRAVEPLALLIVDVDHFKQMNDAHGHQRGDECLAAVARALERALPRVTDFIARYGGEEFACILPATDREGALKIAEQLRAAVAALRIEHPQSEHRILTASIGATVCRHVPGTALKTLVRTADRALYAAKRKGRNRTELALTESQIPALRIVS